MQYLCGYSPHIAVDIIGGKGTFSSTLLLNWLIFFHTIRGLNKYGIVGTLCPPYTQLPHTCPRTGSPHCCYIKQHCKLSPTSTDSRGVIQSLSLALRTMKNCFVFETQQQATQKKITKLAIFRSLQREAQVKAAP